LPKQQAKGATIIVVSAACSATLAIFLKFAFAAGVNITTIISVRFVVAALLLGLVLKARRVPLRLPLPQVLAVCAMGAVGYGGMSLLFANGLHDVSASLAGMLLYTYPAIVTLLSFLLREECFDAWKGGALLICMAGLYLVLGVSYAGTRPAGVVSILGAAFIYSVYILLGNRLLKRIDPLVAATYICASTGLAFCLFGLATGTLQVSLPVQGWIAILGITVFPTFIGIVCFLTGLKLVGASRASILCTLEPFLTVLLSFLLLGERVSWLQISGGALILAGVLALQLKAREREDSAVLREG
jgi:drug/metabolite transporter (DMT)-like permease